MSYYTEKQFTSQSTETEKTSVLFQRYFSDVKGKILEAGCSTGSFLSLSPKKITGIDFDEESVKICRKKGLNALQMDLTKKLSFKDEEFDAVFSSYVIEHLMQPLFMVKELRRTLKKGGKLVIITNDWVRTHDKKHSNFFDDYTHVKPFTKQSLSQVAFDAGFRDYSVEFQPKSFPGFGWIIRKGILKTHHIIALQKFLKIIGITNNSIVLVAVK